jgi:translation initiation factor IF-1
LLGKGVLGLAENPAEVGFAQVVELNPNGKAALQLGNQVARLGHVEGAGGNE